MLEVRNDDRGRLDEIVGTGCKVHLERMDTGVWSLIVEDNSERLLVSLRLEKRTIFANVYEREPL